MGAAFLMASSSIGPGFLTQTAYFTEALWTSFGFVILVSVLLDIGAQLNTWRVLTDNAAGLTVSYIVKTKRAFVATPYLDENRGYILPAGVFLYPAGKLEQPVQLTVKPFAGWTDVATGLDTVVGKRYTYTAADYDMLYDCPLLTGNLEELPPFTVNGIPHRFIGYNMGDFDGTQFMGDLKKIVEAASAIIGHIPYRQYVFIAIGPGAGGIEHTNSTTISFNGSGLNDPQGRLRLLNFIAHEYFHHYNVKRIRPVELGPFDYDHGSRTKMLWVSEGLTVYYEYLILKRAGLCRNRKWFLPRCLWYGQTGRRARFHSWLRRGTDNVFPFWFQRR